MSVLRTTLVAAAIVLAWALLGVRFSGSLHAPDVSTDDARATALARVEGTVLAEHYARNAGRWEYTFDIRPPSDGGKVFFVSVDADRGTLVAVRQGREIAQNANESSP